MKKIWVLLIFLLLVTAISASNIIISMPRTSYQSGETIQAEVFLSITPIQDLTVSNFQFLTENNQNLQVALFLEKLSSAHYFVYFNIPANLQKGNYKFKVKNVNYISNNILQETSEEKAIYINTINSGFAYLLQHQNPDGSFSTVQTTALAALALKTNYPEQAQNAIDYLVQNQDPTGCYPKNNCNVKDTAFALLALYNFNQNIIKTKNWLNDASNNFNLGTWSLIINSTNPQCVFNNQNITSMQQIYPLLSKYILINCTSPVNLKLNHFYLGNIYQIFNELTSYKNYTIDDSGCYGLFYKSSCNYESTGYAVWVLKQLNENPSLNYLQQNPSDTNTLDHALLYLITNNQYSFNWLLNNLQINFWSSQSASLNQIPNNYISSFAAYSLRNNPTYNNVKNYLSDKTTTDELTSALILYLLFDDEILSPSLSISPGIINKKNEINLILTNNNQGSIAVEITKPDYIQLPLFLSLENSQPFNIFIPENVNNSEIKIVYSNYSYTIPIITAQQELFPAILLNPPINSLSLVNFPDKINQTLATDDKTEDVLKLKNDWVFPIYNISFILTGNLNQIIKLEKNTFDIIQPNETLEQRITINQDKNPSFEEYSGYLIITSSQNTLNQVEFNLQFSSDEDVQTSNIESLIEEPKEETEPENKTTSTKPKETTKKKSKWIWLIPFVFIIIIGILIFFLKGKKIKIKPFNQYISEIKR